MTAPTPITRTTLFTLTALVALGPLSTDFYLPALPLIARYFGVDEAGAQATLSAYLIGFAAAILVYGPLSDRFGRRPVLAGGIVIFTLASLGCAVSQSIGALVACRFVQALGACAGPVISRAMVRDLVGAQGAARVFSYLSAAVALAPAIAPIVGGFLTDAFGWRATFVALTIYGAGGLVAVFWILRETNQTRDMTAANPLSWFRIYGSLVRHREYFGYVLAATFGYSGIFCFISGSSFVFINVLGVPPKYFGFCFGVFVIGYIIGATSGGKLSKRMAPPQLVGLGSLIALLSAIALVAVNLVATASVWTVLAPLLPYMIGVGMTMPAAQAGAIGPFPRSAGAASALLGFVQMGVAAGVGAILGVIGSPSPLPMTLMIAAMAVAQMACHCWVIRPALKS
ncbi:multidrug effflux MFS transporter [Dongia rigui]|uniref:Bcr/CflA family efflux transporter n=1 Tax=Dongia rigui TaxID=940149 RepID=A0ABU5E4H0_9PROT|nr:multidrug effflux MFS transporter [Dongia rigui]MDY0874499.1 multidrug effflux MFS transporter [Dongia rigui]